MNGYHFCSQIEQQDFRAQIQVGQRRYLSRYATEVNNNEMFAASELYFIIYLL